MSDKPKIFQEEVRVFRSRWLCGVGDCAGDMKPTGMMIASNPPWYIHRCDFCGREDEAFNQQYPVLEYLPLIEPKLGENINVEA